MGLLRNEGQFLECLESVCEMYYENTKDNYYEQVLKSTKKKLKKYRENAH